MTWAERVAKFGHRCVYCGNFVTENPKFPQAPENDLHQLSKDHVFPKIHRVSDELWNLVPACWRCNRMKNNMSAEEFIASRPGLCTHARNQQLLFTLIREYAEVTRSYARDEPCPFHPDSGKTHWHTCFACYVIRCEIAIEKEAERNRQIYGT